MKNRVQVLSELFIGYQNTDELLRPGSVVGGKKNNLISLNSTMNSTPTR